MGGGNAAVQVVGRTFFRVTMLGYMLSGLAMFPSVILGVSKYYFTWEMDRCTCVLDDDEAGPCVFGKDFVKVDIGWKKYSIAETAQEAGCPLATALFIDDAAALKDDLDEAQSFGAFKKVYPIDGTFQKTDYPTQADEDNGGSESGGGVVAMQVVLSFFAIFTWKILKASYYSNGSHCSIGLSLMTRLNFLMGLGAAASIVSFWWLIEGRFGDDDKALTAALEDVSALLRFNLYPGTQCVENCQATTPPPSYIFFFGKSGGPLRPSGWPGRIFIFFFFSFRWGYLLDGLITCVASLKCHEPD